MAFVTPRTYFYAILGLSVLFVMTLQAPPPLNEAEVPFVQTLLDAWPNLVAEWGSNVYDVCAWDGFKCNATGFVESINISGTNLSGTLPSGLFFLVELDTLVLNDVGLFGPIPSTILNLHNLDKLDLSNNSLTGPIPVGLLQTNMTTLFLSNNSLTGTIPWSTDPYTPGPGQHIGLDGNDLDICPGPRYDIKAPSCSVENQRVESCGCNVDYIQIAHGRPRRCGTSPAVVPECSPDVPYFEPIAPQVPTEVPLAIPVTVPAEVCATPQPAPYFVCRNGVWVATGNIVIEVTTVIQGHVIVEGNITAPQGISISGLSSSIASTGCIDTGSVQLKLTSEELETLKHRTTVNLLSQNSTCTSSLSSTPLIVSHSGRQCKKVNPTNEGSQSNLNVVLKLDSSKCDRWWIITVSVIGGVFLVVAILAIVATKNRTVRLKLRPFLKSGGAPGNRRTL